jgi:hypothetical protein
MSLILCLFNVIQPQIVLHSKPGKVANNIVIKLGIAVAQWLRHCTTNRRVKGSTTAGVIGIFHLYNPGNLNFLEHSGPFQACNGTALL